MIKNNFRFLDYIFSDLLAIFVVKILFIVFNMQKEEILRLIKETIAKTIPSGAKVILFGSQARGDAREDSDWDILILLNKDKVELDDHDYISYPFFELGWNIDVQIHPILYTFKDWMERSFSPFYKNVEREGIDLC